MANLTDLLARFENDIRFGCHSVRAEASRSAAGKALQRHRVEAMSLVDRRMIAMNASQVVDPVEEGVLDGLGMLFEWMRNPS